MAFEALQAEMDLDAKGFTRGMDEAQRSMKSVDQQADQMRKTMGVAGTVMAGVAVGGFAAATNAAASFDAALQESVAIMGDVSDTMRGQMSDAAREVAKTTTFSADEAAESYFYLASAGLTAEESIAALPQVAQFAQAGMFDMATATDLLTDAASALGLELEDYNALADTLVKANTLANATVEQFSTALTSGAAPAMKNVNMATEEGVAILAAWADQGIKGEKAGTLFRSTLTQLQEAAIKNKDAFDQFGVQVFDSSGNMRNMADIVGDLEGAFAGMSDEQKSAALSQMGFTMETQQGILALMGSSEAIRTYESELRNAGGTAQEVAEKQLQTFNAQLDLLKSQVMDVAISIGQVLLPHLTAMVQRVAGVVEWFGNFNDATNGLAGVLALAATGIAGLTTAFVAFSPQIMGVVSVLRTALIPALMGVGAPVAALMVVIGALAAAWTTNFGDIQGKTAELVGMLQRTFAPIVQQVMEIAAGVVGDFVAAWERHSPVILGHIDRIWAAFQTVLFPALEVFQQITFDVLNAVAGFFNASGDDIWNVLFNVIGVALDGVATALETFAAVAERVIFAVGGFWSAHGETIQRVVGGVIGTALATLGALLDGIRTTAETVLGLISGWWEAHGDTVQRIVGGIITVAIATVTGLLEDIRVVAERVFGLVSGWWEAHGGTVMSVVNGVISGAVTTLTGLITGIEETADRVLGLVSGWWETHGQTVQRVADTVLTPAIGAVEGAVGSLQTFVAENLPGVATAFEGMGTRGQVSLTDLSGATDTARDTVNTMATNMGTDLGLLEGDFSSFAQGVKSDMMLQFGELGTHFSNYMDYLQNIVFGPALERMTRLWETHGAETLAEFQETWAAIEPIVTGAIKAIEAVISAFVGTVYVIWRNHGDEFMTLVAFIWDTVGGIIEGALDVILTGLRVVLNLIQGDWGEAWEEVRALTERIFGGIIDWLSNWGGGLLEWIGGVLADALDAFIQWGQDLIFGSLIPDIFNAIYEFITGSLGDLYDFVTGWLGDTYDSFAERFGDIQSFVTDTVDTLRSTVETTLGNWYDYMTGWLDDTYNSFSTRWTNLKDEVIRVTDNMRIVVSNTLKNLYTFITGWLTDTYNSFRTRFINTKDEVIRIVDNLRIRVTNIVTTLLNDIKTKAQNWVSKFLKPFKDAKQRVITEFNNLKSTLVGNSIVPDMLDDLVTESGQWVNPFLGPFRTAKSKAIAEFNELQRKLSGIKSRIAQTVKNTGGRVSGAASKAGRAAGKVASNIRNAVSKALGGTWYVDSGSGNIRGLVNRGVYKSDSGPGGGLNNVRGKLTDAMRAGLAPSRGQMNTLVAKYAKQTGSIQKGLSKFINTHTPFEMAQGGIVSSATRAIIGEGREREAVMPLSKLEQFVNREPGAMHVDARIQVETIEALDADEIEDLLDRYSEKQKRELERMLGMTGSV